jgi:DNA-binding GntR family transcriptional regulator
MPLPQSKAPLARTLARDEAYEKLRAWIVDGTLHPGEILRDQEIAQSLGVSRTPVREALRRLEDEGFVETALNRWTRVAPLDLRKAIEMYGIIEALEVLALQTAQLNEQDLNGMEIANASMRKAIQRKDAVAALRADEIFHGVWIARAQNSELWLLLAQLKTKLRRVELAYWDRAAHTDQSFHEHRAILKALQQGSRRAAIVGLKQNWEGSRQRLRSVTETEDHATDNALKRNKQ